MTNFYGRFVSDFFDNTVNSANFSSLPPEIRFYLKANWQVPYGWPGKTSCSNIPGQ